MPNLVEVSRQIILRWQQPNGAYPACPTMPDYQFCWFRDSSFIAHAMFLHGELASAQAFHHWAVARIIENESKARQAVAEWRAGIKPDNRNALRARYTYDGGDGPDYWPEFQMDGVGTWLWALKAFTDHGNPLDADTHRAVQISADYLAALWRSTCHDLWEEFGDHVHTYSLAAIFAGLQAAAALLKQPALLETASTVRQYLFDHCTLSGQRFIKFEGNDAVDGALTALATPYRVVSPDDAIMQATIQHIEHDLYAPGYGVHRYLKDTYYGGGAWLLLAAWLGWYYAECGDVAQAREILAAIERHTTPDGNLPEQVVPPLLSSQADYEYWVKVRGTIATPLLWSHAMYLILAYHCR